MTKITELPAGTKIIVTKLSEDDGFSFMKDQIEGREFIAEKKKGYHSMAFVPVIKGNGLTGNSIVFFSATEYEIIIPEPINQ